VAGAVLSATPVHLDGGYHLDDEERAQFRASPLPRPAELTRMLAASIRDGQLLNLITLVPPIKAHQSGA
jgi:hypothetical protein